MLRKVLIMVMVLAMSSVAMGTMAGGLIKPLGGDVITIDKDQSDWYAIADLDWLEFGGSASATSSGTQANGKLAARWAPDGIYMLAIVSDDSMYNGAATSPFDWIKNGMDAIEVYWNSDDVDGTSVSPAPLQTEAQSYVLGDGTSSNSFFVQPTGPTNSDWPWGNAVPNVLPNGAIGQEDIYKLANGDPWPGYAYELFLPALDNTGLVASVLSAGDTVGLDVTFASGDTTDYSRYTGPGGDADPFDSSGWSSYTLVPEPITMTLLGLGGLVMIRRKK
jgi:hypothetical protein